MKPFSKLLCASLLFCSIGTVYAMAPLPLGEGGPKSRVRVQNSAPELEYTVTIKNPVSHLYDVELAIRGLKDTSVSVSMPAWEPGVYTIRDFAKNVQGFRAVTARNQPLAAQQTDKQTWQIAKQA